MIFGIDFDNTIVCYDRIFHRVAVERELIPLELTRTKDAVRDYLRSAGREDKWTEIQGYVYGVRMSEAEEFDGVGAFFCRCRELGAPVRIISHKTKRPYRGPACDLHEAALGWLKAHGAFDEHGWGLDSGDVFLELSKEEKLQRIGACGCTHFIDDLPEFLAEPAFPLETRKILFDPNDRHASIQEFCRIRSWREAEAFVDVWFHDEGAGRRDRRRSRTNG